MFLLLTGNVDWTCKADDRILPPREILIDSTVLYRSKGAVMDIVDWSCNIDGRSLNSCQWTGNLRWRMGSVRITGKVRNKLIRSINGNIVNSNIKIIHWNAGGRKWENKLLEVESLLAEYCPDLCFISEANLWSTLDDADRHIPGYKLYLPNTMVSLGHARLVLLAKVDLDLQIIPKKTDKEAATIWVKVGSGKKNSVLIGGIYRQHQLLGRADVNLTSLQILREQELRLDKFCEKMEGIVHVLF